MGKYVDKLEIPKRLEAKRDFLRWIHKDKVAASGLDTAKVKKGESNKHQQVVGEALHSGDLILVCLAGYEEKGKKKPGLLSKVGKIFSKEK